MGKTHYSKYKNYSLFIGVFLISIATVVSNSYYSIIAPGRIKSNHNYTVSVSLHEAQGPATINLRIEGLFYYTSTEVHLHPYQTRTVVFSLPKLAKGPHKLVAEGLSGIEFRNESQLEVDAYAGPKIYIQTDKAIYRPGEEVQFRVLMLDEHTRPLHVHEPIRVEILDTNNIRVKQFKDIVLTKGVYKNKFQLAEYPTLGGWFIKATISGRFDKSFSKLIFIHRYILPKFSAYIKADKNYMLDDDILKVVVYAKYTFDKYVEGNATLRIVDFSSDNILKQVSLNIKTTASVEFTFNNGHDLKRINYIILKLDFTEKYTGKTRSNKMFVPIQRQRYNINIEPDSIEFSCHNRPYRLKVLVKHWSGAPVVDRLTPVVMLHGSREYEAYLNDKGVALFEFVHDNEYNHVFLYKNSSLTFPNIYVDDEVPINQAQSYCNIVLKSGKPRLGTNLEIEVSSVEYIPYINYVIVGHANIVETAHITVPPGRKSHIIVIKPSIEMVPNSFIYVHFIQNGQYRYNELKFQFPMEFENKISVLAPKQVEPGQNITLNLKAQQNSLVGLLAVDLGVYLLDSSYDLQRDEILKEMVVDLTYSPVNATVYPGLVSGVLTLTNAHYIFKSGPGRHRGEVGHPTIWDFRKKFPETWIFENYDITDETTQLSLTVPDSITTWRLTAFTVNEITGFGIVDGPIDIIARKQFFINLNLPYSVKRGEVVNILVLVHNYHYENVATEIILYLQDQEFDFIDGPNTITVKGGSEEQKRVKHITVPANGIEKVEFLIKPKLLGDISLRITAATSLSSDAIIQKLKVEPEGVATRKNKAFYVAISPGETFETTFRSNIPRDIVPDSEYLTLSVSGDSLVPALNNLNSLVLLPTGCGEQNMVNFAPNILVLQFLKASGKYFKERSLVNRAKKFIEIGYQQQLAYLHKNGGFSVFGPRRDGEPSTWLTAYVIRFFIKAAKYLPIEGDIIERGLDFLAENQFESGQFSYTGYVFYSAQQNRFGFTAFVLMTFLEEKKYANKYQDTIQKGLAFLNANLDRINDIYDLSIVATALKMAKHANAQLILEKLKLNKRQTEELIWWSQNDRNAEKDVEITAYVLMALLDNNNNPSEEQKILKWLLDQRNEMGGFKSTHDTVVGLQALVKFSEKYGNLKSIALNIEYTAMNQERKVLKNYNLKVDESNALVLQAEELPKSTRIIEVKVNGSGCALMQISYLYHTITDKQVNFFQIRPKPSLLNPEEMLLNICFDFQEHIISTAGETGTNMILMEVNLPSGFNANEEYVKELLDNEIIQRIEMKNAETKLVVYFEKLPVHEENCLDILTDKRNDVQQRKPAAISVYDYYNISRHDTVFYKI